MNQNDVELETITRCASTRLLIQIHHSSTNIVVDAFAAQHADGTTKPITLTFALVGLYFHIGRNWTGRQVQRVHTLLARRRKDWPRFELPTRRGNVTVSHVMGAPAGPARDEMIETWCASVWQAYGASQRKVVELTQAELG